MKIKLFSHISDPDGLGSVVLSLLTFDKVDYQLCKKNEDLNLSILSFLEKEKYKSYDAIYVCDLCPSKKILDLISQNELLKSKFHVFDHHESMEEMGATYDFVTEEIRIGENGSCATAIFYDYLLKNYPNEHLNTQTTKTFVELTRLHDTWEWKPKKEERAYDLEVIFHKFGVDFYIDHFYRKCMNQDEVFFTKKEKAWILEYKEETKNYVDLLLDHLVIKKEGNITFGSVLGLYDYRNVLADEISNTYFEVDVLVLIAIDSYTVSFRSLNHKYSVRKIAESYGGGGHDFAAACALKKDNRSELLKRFML
ncbi:MAG: hypothetical protein IJ772_04100 [Bacilli bacterium]|nr:hypothetical protein [Bacilli bacterium]